MKPIVGTTIKLFLPILSIILAFWLPEPYRLMLVFLPAAVYPVFFGLKGSVLGIVLFVGSMLYMGLFAPFHLDYSLFIGIVASISAPFMIGGFTEVHRKRILSLTTSVTTLKNDRNQWMNNESQYKSFFDNMVSGFSYQKVIYDKDGTPVDFIFLEVNPAFERLTGLHREAVLQKKLTEALPGVDDPFYDWLGYYEKTARSGREIRVEEHYQSLNKTYVVTIQSAEFGYFYACFHDITEMGDASRDYKKLVENTKDIIARFDKELNCLYLNTNTPYKNKRPMEIIFGEHVERTRIQSELRKHFEESVRRIFRSKKEETIELKLTTPQGLRYFDCRLVPEFSHEGYVDSILCINRDNTIHRSAEVDMQDTLDKLQELENIVNASPVVVYLWLADKKWTVEFISNNVDQFGYNRQLYIDAEMSFLDLIHPGDMERVQEEIDVYLKEGVNEYSQEYRIRTANDIERLVKVETWVRRTKQGDITHYQGMITDVTNMIKMPQTLIESEKRYRNVFDDIQDISFVLSLKGTFLSVNREGEAFFGYTRDELRKMSFLSMLPEENREQGSLIMAEMTSGSLSEKEYKIEILNMAGERRKMRLQCKEIMESGYIGIAVNARDISEQNQVAGQVQYLSDHDKLTGLYNRSFFEEELVRIQKDTHVPLSIIVGDVDGLKLTNDAFGHKQGDQLLKNIADILKESTRVEDSVFRLGGDEFAVIMPDSDENDANRICARIKSLCAQTEELPVQPSIALGSATIHDWSCTIEDMVRQAEDRMNRSKLMESRSIRSAIISSLQKTLEERTFETKKHAERMQRMAGKLGKQLGLSDSEMDDLNLLCVLHDIGKIGIPDNILMKTGRLTGDEWDTMKKHSEIGYNIAIASPDLKVIAESILAHHEHWDGTGYPKHMVGEDIPLIARIITVIDAYDAMTNDRPYHKAVSQIAAIIEIDRCAGSQFDPKIVEAFKKELLS